MHRSIAGMMRQDELLFYDRFVRFWEGKKQQHKLHRSEAEVLLIFTDLRAVLGRL